MRKDRAREMGMSQDQLDRFMAAYGLESVDQLDAMMERVGDGIPAPPIYVTRRK